MSYQLTLTPDERAAIDWVGYRYSCGDDLFDVLMDCESDGEWDDDRVDITFSIPEHKAWDIEEIAEKDSEGGHSPWPCFAPEFAAKMQRFLDSIV